jgi:nucleoid-associated protein YgaU
MRYKNQQIFVNINEAYKRYLKKTRGMENIKQYDTPVFRHPTIEEIKTLNVVSHIWKTGDRYFKLADQYYDDPEMWWVIALYNQKPTEFQLKLGDIVFVPTPLESVLFYIGF